MFRSICVETGFKIGAGGEPNSAKFLINNCEDIKQLR